MFDSYNLYEQEGRNSLLNGKCLVIYTMTWDKNRSKQGDDMVSYNVTAFDESKETEHTKVNKFLKELFFIRNGIVFPFEINHFKRVYSFKCTHYMFI